MSLLLLDGVVQLSNKLYCFPSFFYIKNLGAWLMTRSSVKASFLKRYTDLPSTLAVLRNRELTLLSPMTWDDTNDRGALAHYAERKKFKTLLGVCFSQAIETYHHWKVFAPGSAGVCIYYFKDKLLDIIPKADFSHRLVNYKSPTQLLASYALLADMPFTKADAYRDEIEYRIIYSSMDEDVRYKTIPINLGVIRSIVLSPWMAPAQFEATKESLHAIDGCADIPITQSTVVSNQAWLEYVKKT